MPDIRHQIEIGAAPEAVYPLVSSAAGFAQWWAADVRDIADPTPAVELGFFGRKTIYRLRPQTFLPPSQAAWHCETGQEWSGTQLSFILSRQAQGTVLRFSHAAWQKETDYYVSCNTTWGALLFRLKAAAEGRRPGPLFTADALAY
jgi:uncharacterized protein YndB with AHSA1/START domain